MLQRALKILNYSQRAEQDLNEVHEVVYIRKNANSLKPRFKMGELHGKRATFPTSGSRRTKMSELGWAHEEGVGIDVQMDAREYFQLCFRPSESTPSRFEPEISRTCCCPFADSTHV